MRKLSMLFCLGIALLPRIAMGQGVAVNSTGSAANSSAIFDVSSTTQGVLIPRMTTAQRTAISSPATGLLVYQTDGTAGFYFYTGSAWTSLNSYTNVTTQGNTFNGANELVQTNSSAYINTANLGSGISVDSTKFLRGNNTWGAPIAYGNIRTVTSSTTLSSSDQIVFCNNTSLITITLLPPSLVPKGYQLNLVCGVNAGIIGVIVASPSGTTQNGNAGSFTVGVFGYYANLVSDGNNTWYWIQGR